LTFWSFSWQPRRLLLNPQLTIAAATYLTAGASTYATTKKVTVTNVTANAVTLTLYKVPNAGTAGATNTLVSAMVIPPNTVNGGVKEIYEAENQTLAPGDTLQALAGTAAALNLNISGIQQTP
jgi:hypothetical protein